MFQAACSTRSSITRHSDSLNGVMLFFAFFGIFFLAGGLVFAEGHEKRNVGVIVGICLLAVAAVSFGLSAYVNRKSHVKTTEHNAETAAQTFREIAAPRSRLTWCNVNHTTGVITLGMSDYAGREQLYRLEGLNFTLEGTGEPEVLVHTPPGGMPITSFLRLLQDPWVVALIMSLQPAAAAQAEAPTS